MKAHRRLVEVDWSAARARWAVVEPRLDEAAEASYRELVAPGLRAVARVGNTYTASLYLCLASLLESEGRALASRRLGLFSYGSGCCAELFTGTVPRTVEAVADAGVTRALAERQLVDVDLYERFVRAGDAGGEPPSGFTGDFVFHGVRGERREYGRLAAALAA